MVKMENDENSPEAEVCLEEVEIEPNKHVRYKDGILNIGCCGELSLDVY